MTTRRKFNFPLATLLHSAELLHDALQYPDYQTDMTARLGAGFIADFPAKIAAVNEGSSTQSGQTGDLSQLTAQQRADFAEMERLASGARRSARLAFPGQDTILAAEFQVGEAGSKSIAASIARARLTHTAAVKYAPALQEKGWIPADTAALDAAIDTLALLAGNQDEAGDNRLAMTNEKIIAANALYADCQAIQNAARLQYPNRSDANGNAQNLTPRARFLLDSFPPRIREEEDEEEPVTPPTP